MRRRARLFALALIFCLPFTPASAQPDLSGQIEAARSEGVDVLAPSGFSAAVRAYEAALQDRERGRNEERIQKRLDEAEAALQRATLDAAAARQSFANLIDTRQDALAADAPKFEPDVWQKANERFLQAMMANEEGDAKDAQRRAAEAEVLLRDVELSAIKHQVLREARALIADADAAKVERWAPRTLQTAKRRLADAEQEIQRNRYDLGLPRRLAEEARYEAGHAMFLSQLAQRTLQAERDDAAGVEALVLSIEEPLKRMASEMEAPVRFDRGFDAPLRELAEHAQQQAQEIRRLKLELEDREQRIASLSAQVERLDSRLGGVSEERIALQRRVDAQERLRSNVAMLQTAFTDAEARVERQGDDVVLSMLGLGFAPGRSTITADGAALLKKASQAFEMFPGAAIAVEGHTDANGGDSANLILSQDRADAVKQHIVSNFAVDPEQITSIGYGEARPVATNETAAGRARNRRIDLVIRPQPR